METRKLIQYHITKKKTQINKNWIGSRIGFCVCGLKPHS
jgi:hypothetical protein